jgi:enoyl-CoA hydratase
MSATVRSERRERSLLVTIDRPERRNAVDRATADALFAVFEAFDDDAALDVAVLAGAGGAFCAGADLKALAAGEQWPIEAEGKRGPMGPTRLRLRKPVIAAIEGPAVAGGLELALWCDLRVAGQSSIFGVLNRRFGVPLIDLGTIRLPRMIGHGRALDLILTGKVVGAQEALAIGLVNRVVGDGEALEAALALASQLASFPQAALRNDRLSVYEQWELDEAAAIRNEIARGKLALDTGEALRGAARFATGEGRHASGG